MAKWQDAPLVPEPNQPKWAQAPIETSGLPPATSGSGQQPVSDPSDVTAGALPMSPEERIYRQVAYSFAHDTSSIGSMIGGTAGGLAGPLTIGQIPPLTALPEELVTVPLTGAIGAFLGGTGGDLVQQATQPGGIVDWRSAARKGGWEAATEAASPFVMRGLKRTANVLPIPIFGRPSTGPRGSILLGERLPKTEARRAFQESVKHFEKRGGVTTPAQVDDRWWHHVYDALARGAWGGTDTYANRLQENAPLLVEMAKDSIDDITTKVSRETHTEVGESMYRMFGRHLPAGKTATKIDAWHRLFDPVYEQVDALSTGPAINARSLKQFAAARLALDQGEEAGNILTKEGRSVLKQLAELDDDISLSTMRGLRSKYGGAIRQFSKDMNTDEAMIAKLQSIADDSIRNAATSPALPTDARRLLLQANSDYARYREVMERVLPYRLTEKLADNPEQVVGKLFPAPKRGSEAAVRHIERVRDALILTPEGKPDPVGRDLWDRLREAWVTGIIDKHAERGTLNTAGLRSELRRYGAQGLDILLPLEQRRILESVLNLNDAVMRGGKFGGGALVAKSAQAAGGYAIYRGTGARDFVNVISGGMLLFGPMTYAKLANSPIGSKLLRAAIMPHKNEREVVAIATRIARYMQGEQKKEKQQQMRLDARYQTEFNRLLPQRPTESKTRFEQQTGFGVGRGF